MITVFRHKNSSACVCILVLVCLYFVDAVLFVTQNCNATILTNHQKKKTGTMALLFFVSAFDPFGKAPMSKPQEMMGSFLGPGNVGQPDPFLHAARSPSPTLQPTSLGKACFCCSAAFFPHSMFWRHVLLYLQSNLCIFAFLLCQNIKKLVASK